MTSIIISIDTIYIIIIHDETRTREDDDMTDTKPPFDTPDFFTPDGGTHYFNIQHREIINRLQYFVDNKQIPNIIFYGNNSCGKKTILKYFINQIYRDASNIKDNILSINCCHGKGNIKFIREELKLFANSIIINKSGSNIKSVILLNADCLTIDAQSSLRRLIEINNKSTRFFIVVNNYERLLKPIISRFCSIYFNPPTYAGKSTTFCNILYNGVCDSFNKNIDQATLKRSIKRHDPTIIKTKTLDSVDPNPESNPNISGELIQISNILYNHGFSSLDLIKYIENLKIKETSDNVTRYKMLSLAEIVGKEFRNERLSIYFLLNYIYFRYNFDIKKLL